MKTLNFYKSLSTVILLIPSFMIIGTLLYAGINDKSDRLSASQSSVFSPGYINAAKQQTDAIIRQVNPDKNIFERTLDIVKANLSNKVNEGVVDKPVPELKKKTSQGETAVTKKTTTEETVISSTAESPEGTVLITENYNIDIGSGILPHYEDGRLISEYINGVKHIYAGFTNVGFASDGTTSPIQKAINMSNAGDVIIVSQGRYETGMDERQYKPISVSENARIYGGFDDNGVRDILNNKTYILGNINVNKSSAPMGATDERLAELNGLYVNGTMYLFGGRFATVALNKNSYIHQGDNLYREGDRVGCNIYTVNKNSYYYTGPGAASKDGRIYYRSKEGGFWVFNFSGATVVTDNPPNLAVQGKQMGIVEIPPLPPNLYGERNVSNYQNTTGSTSLENSDHNKTIAVFSRDPDKKSNPTSIGKILKSDNSLLKGKEGSIEYSAVVNTIKDDLDRYALAVNVGIIKEVTGGDEGIKHMLASIMDNPNEDQKQVLGLVEDLLNEANRIAQDSSSPEEVKKASDDLLQMAAALLIAQAIPDLLKEGDVANMKNTFTELNTTKGKILSEYNELIGPYYEEVKKILINNISFLQLNNIISKNISKEELEKLEPNEIDKIFKKLRDMSDKSFEEDYMLQQEAKYRKTYIEPNKKVLEDRMKEMMKDFTGRLSKILESANPPQK